MRKRGQKTPNGYDNIESMLKGIESRGAEIGVCGSCMDAGGIADEDLADGTRRSTLDELTDWTVAAG